LRHDVRRLLKTDSILHAALMRYRLIVINVVLLAVSMALMFWATELIAFVQDQVWFDSTITPSRDSTYYLKNVLTPYPAIKRDYYNGSCRSRYSDYYYFAFECKSETINTTPYYWSRAVPDSAPLGEGQWIIWLFGGSTMFNMTASDELTIANQLAKHLNRTGRHATVINFGMGGFSSTQEEIKFADLIRRVQVHERPDIVVFYDGYNDAAQSMTFGAGNLQEDITAKVKFMIEGNYDPLLFYFVSNQVARHSNFWRLNVSPLVDHYLFRSIVKMRPQPDPDFEKAVQLYMTNTRIIRGVSREFNVKPIFALQPMIFTKQPLTRFEQDVLKDVVEINRPHADYMRGYYQSVQRQMAKDEDFIDLTHVLDSRNEDDFIDHGHTAPETGVVIGASLHKALIKRYPVLSMN
jgi:hypothetical protein